LEISPVIIKIGTSDLTGSLKVAATLPFGVSPVDAKILLPFAKGVEHSLDFAN
jgi:hypothetical protein